MWIRYALKSQHTHSQCHNNSRYRCSVNDKCTQKLNLNITHILKPPEAAACANSIIKSKHAIFHGKLSILAMKSTVRINYQFS